MKTVIAAITSVIALSAFAASEKADVVLERLKHPASVCVMGDPCSENLGKAPVAAAARTGDQVYNGACAACHATGAAGAPKMGDAGAWAAVADGMRLLLASAPVTASVTVVAVPVPVFGVVTGIAVPDGVLASRAKEHHLVSCAEVMLAEERQAKVPREVIGGLVDRAKHLSNEVPGV